MTEEKVTQLIREGLPGAQIFVADTRGSGDHFNAIVVAPQFEGMTLLQTHQAVYKTVESVLTREIHALQLKTYTPAQWKKEQKEEGNG